MSLLRHAVSDEDANREVIVPGRLGPGAKFSVWRVATEPRPYHIELLVWALLNPRVIAFLPTGAGQSLVAALALGSLSAANTCKRTAFLTERMPRLYQEAEYLRKETGLQVEILCGEGNNRKAVLSKPFEVLATTAEAFRDCLIKEELHVSQFSLIVIDDVSPCIGPHALTNVIFKIMDCHERRRPHVLGFVTNPSSTPSEHATEVNMNILEGKMRAVFRTPMHEIEELLERDMLPDPSWMETVLTPKTEEFYNKAMHVLKTLETGFNQCVGVESLFGGRVDDPSGWHSVSRHIDESGWNGIGQYARLGAVIAEAVDVTLYLGDKLGSRILASSAARALSEGLSGDLPSRIHELIEWPYGDFPPTYSRMEHLIRNKAHTYGLNFRALVFVKTRRLARLFAQILSQGSLSDLRPRCLSGQGGADGLRASEQGPILDDFKRGVSKLLVVTSVVEESLEPAACQLVIRMDGNPAALGLMPSPGSGRVKLNTYFVLGIRSDEGEFYDMQRAEEWLNSVAHKRMQMISWQVSEDVRRCVGEVMEGKKAAENVAVQNMPAQGHPREERVAFIVHGLPTATYDELLGVVSRHGRIVAANFMREGCTGRRPVGHSALVQLQGRSTALSAIAYDAPGIWVQQASQSKAALDSTLSMTLQSLDVGVLMGPKGFAQVLGIRGAVAQVAPEHNSVIIRFQETTAGADEEEEETVKTKVRLDSNTLADFSIVDKNGDKLDVYIPLVRPPRFFAENTFEARNGLPSSVSRRKSMPAWPFGCCFFWRLRCADHSQLNMLVAMLERISVRICFARIQDQAHNLPIMSWPVQVQSPVQHVVQEHPEVPAVHPDAPFHANGVGPQRRDSLLGSDRQRYNSQHTEQWRVIGRPTQGPQQNGVMPRAPVAEMQNGHAFAEPVQNGPPGLPPLQQPQRQPSSLPQPVTQPVQPQTNGGTIGHSNGEVEGTRPRTQTWMDWRHRWQWSYGSPTFDRLRQAWPPRPVSGPFEPWHQQEGPQQLQRPQPQEHNNWRPLAEEVTEEEEAQRLSNAEEQVVKDCTETLQLIKALGAVEPGSCVAEGVPACQHLTRGVEHSLLSALHEEPLLMLPTITHNFLEELMNLDAPLAKAVLDRFPARLASDGLLFADLSFLLRDIAEKLNKGARASWQQATLPPNHALVPRMRVTPTRIMFLPAEETLANRVLREFGGSNAADADDDDPTHGSKGFLRVEFRDEQGDTLQGIECLSSKMSALFDQGLKIGRLNFQYLHWSNSQLRVASLWLYAPQGAATCANIRAWPFQASCPKKPSKYASRLALFFSTSLPSISVPVSDVQRIPDVERDGFCFTDGAGRISLSLASRVAEAVGLQYVPSAFQIRYGGAKGIVVAYPDAGPEYENCPVVCTYPLELRPSLVKFESVHDSFEIVSWSRYNGAVLNQQIILLLAAHGIPKSVFLRMHEQALRGATKNILEEDCAARRLRRALSDVEGCLDRPCLGVGRDTTTHQLRDAGVSLLSEPLFASLLAHLYSWDVRRLRQKTNIHVPEAAALLGVPDETETLEYEQVFIQMTELDHESGLRRRRVITGPVAIAKNPCLHPGDVLRLTAVDCPQLAHIVDCIVFPVKGPRPHPDETSGSDLDGDMYFITWCSDLIPERRVEAMDFASTAEEEEVENLNPSHMRDYYIRSTTNTSLGAIANSHKILADQFGADDPRCIRLAKLHSDAVDAPKTGKPVDMPLELQVRAYPAWMERDEGEVETSVVDTLLQQLHDQCPRDPAPDTSSEIPIEPRFLLAGRECFREEAEKLLAEYNLQVFQLMRRFGLSCEAEVLTCCFDKRVGGPKERLLATRTISASYTCITSHYQKIFLECPEDFKPQPGWAEWKQLRASAWYEAAYSHPDMYGMRLLSFAWLASDTLITIPPETSIAKQPKQMLLEGIGRSLGEHYRGKMQLPVDVWGTADSLQLMLSSQGVPVSVVPLGLHGVGVLGSAERQEYACIAVRASMTPQVLRHLLGLPHEADALDAIVPARGKRPELLIQLREPHDVESRHDAVLRCRLTGWFACNPGLAAVCFTLICWVQSQAQPFPLTAVDICILFAQHLAGMCQEMGIVPPDPAGNECFQDVDLEAAISSCNRAASAEMSTTGLQIHAGAALHGFLEALLDKTKECPLLVESLLQEDNEPRVVLMQGTKDLQVVRVAVLRAYQQLCVDRHIQSMIDGTASPDIRSKFFRIRNCRADTPLEAVEQHIGAVGVSEVKVTLDCVSAPLPVLKIMVRGTRDQLGRAALIVHDMRKRLAVDNSRLVVNWANNLLVDAQKDQILAELRSRRVVIVTGSTGSGKSTGVPRMMLDDLDILCPKRIICTQPRRVAATTLAQRLAKLCNCTLGEEVGYRIGGQSEWNPGKTQLLYEVNAIAMVQFLQGDVPCTHLVIDEVHNRTLFDDILMAVVRDYALAKDRNLKVVLMSAATDSIALARFFKDEMGKPAPILEIPGSSFTIKEWHLDEIPFFRDEKRINNHDDITSGHIAEFVWHLHLKKGASSRFLVFLAGRGDISGVQAALYELQDEHGEQLDVRALHSSIPVESQMITVQPQEYVAVSIPGFDRKKRTIILATDVVESSVTMPDVDVVIDSCLHKRKKWNSDHNEMQLAPELISRDEALQRRGRTGRMGPGAVYRLIPRWRYRSLLQHAVPQMQTASISEILLLLSDSRLVDDPKRFLLEKTLSPPKARQVDDAYLKLKELGALEYHEQSRRWIPSRFGRMLQKLPLEPELGLLVWSGLRLGVLEACMVIAGVVQRGTPFLVDSGFKPSSVRNLVRLRHFCCPDSDLLAGLRAYEAWQAYKAKKRPTAAEEAAWCWDHYFSLNVLQEIEEMTTQIHVALAELELAPALETKRLIEMRNRRRMHREVEMDFSTRDHDINDPAVSVSHFVEPWTRSKEEYKLIRWCILLAFAQNNVNISGGECMEVIYKCRRRRGRYLETFLYKEMSLMVNGRPQEKSHGEVRVRFHTPDNAQRAVQMGNLASGYDFPFSTAPRLANNNNCVLGSGFQGADGRPPQVFLGSESVCAPVVSPPATLVAATILLSENKRGDDCISGSKLTQLPRALLPVVLSCRQCHYSPDTGVVSQVLLRGAPQQHVVHQQLRGLADKLRHWHRTDSCDEEARMLARRNIVDSMDWAERIEEETAQHLTKTMTLWDIEPSRYGRIIGKGGSNIVQLSKEFPKVNIHVPKAHQTGYVTVTGPPDDCSRAVHAIRRTL